MPQKDSCVQRPLVKSSFMDEVTLVPKQQVISQHMCSNSSSSFS